MKKHGKLLALLLALVMVLAACSKGGQEKPAENTAGEGNEGGLKGEISVQVEEGWKAYYEETVKRVMEKNPDIKIELKESGSFDHLDIIDSTSATNADVADVFAIPADRFDGLRQNEVLAALPAAEMAKELGGFDNFDEGLGGAFKDGDDYLAFPYNIETLVTFVNTKNAEANNVDYKNPMELTAQQDPASILLPLNNAWFGVAPNNAGGIELLSEKDGSFMSTYSGAYNELTADQKAVFDGMYAYWKLQNDNNTALLDKDAGGGYIDDQFKTGGKGVARLDGPWAAGGDSIIAKEIQAGNVEIYPVNHLTVAGKEFSQWKGGWALVANSRIEDDADKMKIAEEFIKELVNPERAVDLYRATGKILENAKLEQYTGSDLSDTDKKLIENVLESYEVSVPRPLFKEFGGVWETWENSILSWNSLKPATPEDAYKELNASFTDLLQQIQK